MADYVLTVYGDDDETQLFEVGTAAGHPYPYLHMPQEFSEASVDLVNGGAVIGQYNLRVIDPQNGATQLERWMTSKLPSASGHSALMRRRAVFKEVAPASRVILDGVIGRIQLSESKAGFIMDVRDVRERGREVRVFTHGGTTSLLPRGIVPGYGKLGKFDANPFTGGWLVAPTVPLTGVANTATGTHGSYGTIAQDDVGNTPNSEVSPRLVVTRETQTALASPELFEIWWRPNPDDGQGWRKLKHISFWSLLPPNNSVTRAGPAFLLNRKARDAEGNLVDVKALYGIHFDDWHEDSDAAPADGRAVEYMVVYVGEPTEEHPFHWEGYWDDFLIAMLDGDFSERAPRIRYDETAIRQIQAKIRMRITEPRDDLREVLEELHKAIGAAPALNSAGEIAPILYELPTSVAGLTVLDDDNCQPVSGWEHSGEDAITAVEVTYYRDVRVPIEQDIDGTAAAGDLLVEKELTVGPEAPPEVLDVMGRHVLEIDGWMFRSLGGDQGDPITGDVADDLGHRAAVAAGHRVLDRFVYGGTNSAVLTTAGVVPGAWELDVRRWS